MNLLPLKRQQVHPQRSPPIQIAQSWRGSLLCQRWSQPSHHEPSIAWASIFKFFLWRLAGQIPHNNPPFPTKRRVISAGLISLSPLANTPKTEPISKRRLEFPEQVNYSTEASDNRTCSKQSQRSVHRVQRGEPVESELQFFHM
ncbi:hypothetical protein AVEN_205762-1 [Araneus ventricosus]|uniref:Uncharacterized protein n=1 Tax=Araneus ventricosus TaxID=182803 RepID=A0A4Y2SNL6_ARAVE|nr:hypothetical protein AVEN_205762-1 [Araneus ventricosus]